MIFNLIDQIHFIFNPIIQLANRTNPTNLYMSLYNNNELYLITFIDKKNKKIVAPLLIRKSQEKKKESKSKKIKILKYKNPY